MYKKKKEKKRKEKKKYSKRNVCVGIFFMYVIEIKRKK
jgi:hypothetical protein